LCRAKFPVRWCHDATLFCLLLLCAVATGGRSAQAQAQAPACPSWKVDVKRIEVDGQRMYEVDASGSVLAPPASVWKILTTYERMANSCPTWSRAASCRATAMKSSSNNSAWRASCS
jgi:hypothetical protein